MPHILCIVYMVSFVHVRSAQIYLPFLLLVFSDCGYPISMADGHVSAQATTYGSVASYSCNTGYNMNGTATRTCEAEAGGTWNGSVPTCNIVGE